MKNLIDLFCVSRKTIERWIASGTIPPPIKVGRKNLWDPATIEGLVEQLSSKATSAK
jgi:predicted DNA-binding transcriptional regulator AlpA